MTFEELPSAEQIELIKTRFEQVIENIFNHPLSINRYVETGDLDKQQAKQIRKQVSTLNFYSCPCCRKFDRTKLTTPINEVYEPLIDISKKSLTSNVTKHQQQQ